MTDPISSDDYIIYSIVAVARCWYLFPKGRKAGVCVCVAWIKPNVEQGWTDFSLKINFLVFPERLNPASGSQLRNGSQGASWKISDKNSYNYPWYHLHKVSVGASFSKFKFTSDWQDWCKVVDRAPCNCLGIWLLGGFALHLTPSLMCFHERCKTCRAHWELLSQMVLVVLKDLTGEKSPEPATNPAAEQPEISLFLYWLINYAAIICMHTYLGERKCV